MKRLQVCLPEELLEQLQIYAQSRGIPLAEALRQAGKEFTAKPTIKKEIKEITDKKRKNHKNPLLAMAGMLKGGLTNASTTIDDIYKD